MLLSVQLRKDILNQVQNKSIHSRTQGQLAFTMQPSTVSRATELNTETTVNSPLAKQHCLSFTLK